MIICESCGEESPHDAQYCIMCGIKILEYTGVTKRLSKAYAFIKDNIQSDYRTYIESIMKDAVYVDSYTMNEIEQNDLFLPLHYKGIQRAGLYMGTLYIER